MKNKPFAVAFALVAALAAARTASAAFYEEHFNTDTTNVTNTYPQYVLSFVGTAAVTNQQLRIVKSDSSGGILATTQLFGPAISDIHVELKVEGTLPGNSSAGLFLGAHPLAYLTGYDNTVEFFPGYTVTPGEVRVQGPITFIFGESFVPAQGIMHALDIHTDGTGLFTVKVTEGTSANSFVAGTNSFSASWSNPGLTNGYNIGFYMGGVAGATETFDNLIVIPEPAACALLTTALGLLLWFKARKR